ncbi:MAG TPA: DUF927 domain-containing protein, partial [Acidocella sp.]|nr:DUF927 domain-containing protein [Acidocella sp.]
MRKQQHISLEDARSALAFIAPDDRDTWLRMGMALKSEFGEPAFDCFDAWSQGAPSYNAKDARSVWKSFKAAGRVTIGTLIHEAKARGWKPAEPAAPPDPGEFARRKREREERATKAARETQEKHAAAAHEARQAFEAGTDGGTSPYLQSKAVRPHGVRFADAQGGRVVLVPMRDAGGTIQNLQRIAPGVDKRFLPGGRVSGLFHLVGTLAADAPLPLLIAEGYATVCTLHEATGHVVACAFNANNLVHVAQVLRSQYRRARILICADDDRGTEAKIGKNPGMVAAEKAARVASGVRVKPEPLPDGKSDFNDLARASGLPAVKTLIDAALALAPSETAAPDGANNDPAGELPPRFNLNEKGLWHFGVDKDGKDLPPLYVCSPLRVTAKTRDSDNGEWGFLLEFEDPEGNAKRWAMPARLLAGDGAEYRGYLLSEGLRIGSSSASRQRLTEYLQRSQPNEYVRCADTIGWHGTQFVLPDRTVGTNGERVIFQSTAALKNSFRTRGTLDDWQKGIASWCARPADHPQGELLNTRLVFAVACAFAGPLLKVSGMESGGFHLRSDSTTGKTTVLRLAGSVWGGDDFMQRWRATDNALEALAAQHCDTVLILDELAQVEARVAGEACYMLMNGTGKARAQRTGAPRPVLAWRVLTLSSGELGLADHMAEADKKTRAGQEVRLADVPADAGAGLGVFDSVDGHAEGGAGLAKALGLRARRCYGTAGEAWLRWLVDHLEGLPQRARQSCDAFVHTYAPPAAASQVQRVGARFGLVAFAAELASEAGITGWGKGQGTAAAAACFKAWIAARGGVGNTEQRQMIAQVRGFLLSHAEARFPWWHRQGDDHAPNAQNRAGLRRLIDANENVVETKRDHYESFGEGKPDP